MATPRLVMIAPYYHIKNNALYPKMHILHLLDAMEAFLHNFKILLKML